MRFNHQIRVPKVRLIGENGEQMGIVTPADAMIKAQELGMDVVEVSPNTEPPVCKLMDYGKFKYKQKKKDHQARRKSQTGQLKEIRISPKIGEHDLEIKINHAKEFLKHRNKVLVSMRFRGREMAHMDLGRKVFEHFAQATADGAKVEKPLAREMRTMNLILAPK
ncbi:MAG: translation initiation factor IF-3 [Planctomycetota bacterium]